MTDVRENLARLIDGYLVTQLLYVAVVLGVPEALGTRARSAEDLAVDLGAEPGALHRVLRGLAAAGVLDEQADGCFALTPAGDLLRPGTEGSLAGTALVRGGVYYPAGAGLLSAVRGGGTPYESVNGAPFFTDLASQPDRREAFHAAMVARSSVESAAVVAAHDFSRYSSVVDVGGGTGTLLRAIHEQAPGVRLELFDRPEVVQSSPWPAQGGDFFEAVPPGADAYVLSRIIHDWDDDSAVRILQVCRAAMTPTSTLLVIDALLPERAADDPAAIRMDLHMLLLLGGRERTRAEFAGLFHRAGLRLAAVTPTRAAVHLLTATLL